MNSYFDISKMTREEITNLLRLNTTKSGRIIEELHVPENFKSKEVLKAIETRMDYFEERDTFNYTLYKNMREYFYGKIEEIDPGLANPIEITKIKNPIHISSSHRADILNTASSDYKISLGVPLNNVLSLKLVSYSIPMSWYTIDDRNNTIVYTTTNNADDTALDKIQSGDKIILPNGNYNAESLALKFIEKFNELNLTIQGDIVYNKDLQRLMIDKDFQGTFILSGFNIDVCGLKKKFVNENSNRLESSLGYLLGFRTNYTSKNELEIFDTYQETTNGETKDYKMLPGIVSSTRHNLIHIILDDKQLNRQSYTFNMDVQDDTLNDYSFYLNEKKQHIIEQGENENLDDPCNNQQEEFLNAEACLNNTEANVKRAAIYDKYYTKENKISGNLHYAEMAKKQRKNQTHSVKLNISNHFHTITFTPRASKINVEDDTPEVIYSDPGKICREFFGSVSINTFLIKIVDQNGIIIDLNNLDWHLVLEVEQLYQHKI